LATNKPIICTHFLTAMLASASKDIDVSEDYLLIN
jgi:hypothetical protein